MSLDCWTVERSRLCASLNLTAMAFFTAPFLGAFGVDLVDFLGAAFFGAAFGLLAGFDVLPVFGVPAFFTAIGLTSLQDIFA